MASNSEKGKQIYKIQLAAATLFRDYISNNYDSGSHTKISLKKIYEGRFKKDAKASDLGSIPSFASVLTVLCHRKLVMLIEQSEAITYKFLEDCHEGPSVQKQTTDVSHKEPGRKPTRQRSNTRRSLAVDQHVTLSELDKMIEDLPLEPGQVSTDVMPTGIIFTGGYYACKVCGTRNQTRNEVNNHLGGKRHRHGVLIRRLKMKRDDLTADKKDVTLICKYDDQVSEFPGDIRVECREPVTMVATLELHNNSDVDCLVLRKCEMLRYMYGVVRLSDKENVTKRQMSLIIEPGGSYNIDIKFRPKYLGKYVVPVALYLTWETDAKKVHIVRVFNGHYTNKLMDELEAKVPYKPPPRVHTKRANLEQVEGLPLPRRSTANQLERDAEMKNYYVPVEVRQLINRGLEPKKLEDKAADAQKIKGLLKAVLSMSNYNDRFSLLLYLEEIQMEVDIRKYDLKGVSMIRPKENKRLLTLQVPGLAENRPSVLKGDHLFVQISRNKDKKDKDSKGQVHDKKEYKGYVHDVGCNEVRLGFGESLMKSYLPNMKFDVRFVFGRWPIIQQHRAVDLAGEHRLNDFLFPTTGQICQHKPCIQLDRPIKLYDAKLESNAQQVLAVKHILAGSSRPAPYVVFGPPGTGKTVTVVEAMKQVYKRIPTSHILACAPSNSAADLIVERLMSHVDKRHIIRLNATSRLIETVPDKIKDLCNYDKDEHLNFYPPKKELQEYRIIVCTLVTAGRLAMAEFPTGHFSHVFIDEAGHAVEPEAIIALTGILDKSSGQAVLAGDPEQLGPVLRSPLAIKYGLGLSLLERYMKQTSVYRRVDNAVSANEAYDIRLIVKLVHNYRSHPAILYLPNTLFYNNELIACADKLLRESLCQWTELPQKGFPLVFHGVIGQDQREERSPSFFNPQEVIVVNEYVGKLLDTKQKLVKQADIGIIAPYRKQVQKLRAVLGKKYPEVKVGSVEEFQGQERKVIILTTVRSNPEYLALDTDCNIGFVKNPKRFNVAITRAKALIIVVGNPYILAEDHHWNSYMKYCKQNNAYTGCQYDESTEDDLDDIIHNLNQLGLNDMLGKKEVDPIFLYHYTSKESRDQILESGMILTSDDLLRDAVLGRGVYFTDISPASDPEVILRNNYGPAGEHQTHKIQYCFRIAMRDLPGVEKAEVGRGRVVYVYKDEVNLKKVTYQVLKLGEDEGLLAIGDVTQQTDPEWRSEN